VGWDWDFGDGNSDAGEAVTHQYAANGTYAVTFTATDNEGKSSSIAISVSAGNYPPAASFIYQPDYPAVDQEVLFFDTSVDPDGEIVARDWDFGDDVTGHGSRPRHTYAEADVYTVTLTVIDNRGATATAVASIDLTNAPPTAAFTWTPPSPTTATVVQFTDTSTDNDGSVVAWAWYFGDGSAPSTVQNPTHQFSQAGIYWVTLEVADDGGAASTLWQAVTVAAP
jgi:PKD repeat protein